MDMWLGFYCFIISIVITVANVFNQHVCEVSEGISGIAMECKYVGDGEYAPDRNLKGIRELRFSYFCRGTLVIADRQMPDLRLVEIGTTQDDICSRIIVGDAVQVIVSNTRCSVQSKPLVETASISPVKKAETSPSSTTKTTSATTVSQKHEGQIHELLRDKTTWLIIGIVFIVITTLILATFVTLRIRRRRSQMHRIPSMEEVHFQIPTIFKRD